MEVDDDFEVNEGMEVDDLALPEEVQLIFTCGEARRSMDHNWPSFVRPFESSQESLYRPEKQGIIGN